MSREWIYYPPTEIDILEGFEDYGIAEKSEMPSDMPHYIGTVYSEENARLIAAAPEMYKILKAFAECRAEDDMFDIMEDAQKLVARIDGKEDSYEK